MGPAHPNMQPPGRQLLFYAPGSGEPSPVAKELKKLHASVQVELLRQVEELAERGGPAKQPKRLQHGVRVCEFICRGPHGHARLLLHETADYVLVLEVFKKKGNSTPTANAVSRLAQWEEWHAN